MKEISLFMSRSYGPGRYDPRYEEGGQDYPIGFVRWTEKRNMEAFLDLLSSEALHIEPLLAHRFPVEEGETAYKALHAGAYTGIIDYRAPTNFRISERESVSSRSAQPVAADKLRIGCVGAGGFARSVIFPYFRSSAEIILESVASNSGATAESVKTGFGFRVAESPSALLCNPNVDAVFILTRHDSHAAYAKSALEQGKAVFVEKPLAVDREQLEMVRRAYAKRLAENRSPFLMVGFNRRFSPVTESYAGACPVQRWVHPSYQLDSRPGKWRPDRRRVVSFCRLGASGRALSNADNHCRGSARRRTVQPG
jgi:hypothetical protein